MQKQYTRPQTSIVTIATADGVMDDIHFGTGSNISEGEAPSKGNADFEEEDHSANWE